MHMVQGFKDSAQTIKTSKVIRNRKKTNPVIEIPILRTWNKKKRLVILTDPKEKWKWAENAKPLESKQISRIGSETFPYSKDYDWKCKPFV